MEFDKGVIAYRDGWLCIQQISNDFNEPKRYIQYWPIERGRPKDFAHIVGKSAGYDRQGVWWVRLGVWTPLPLTDGEKTKMLTMDTEMIPCPKVRKGIETRYRHGQWERYLKSSGWTAF